MVTITSVNLAVDYVWLETKMMENVNSIKLYTRVEPQDKFLKFIKEKSE